MDNETNRQTAALKKKKVFRIFTDTVSGLSTQRLGLDGALHIAAYTLTDGKSYYNQNPTDSPSNWASENEKSRDTDRNDVSRLHTVPQSGFEPPTPALGEPCSIP